MWPDAKWSCSALLFSPFKNNFQGLYSISKGHLKGQILLNVVQIVSHAEESYKKETVSLSLMFNCLSVIVVFLNRILILMDSRLFADKSGTSLASSCVSNWFCCMGRTFFPPYLSEHH